MTSSAISLRRPDVAIPKYDATTILLHPFASSPDGPAPSFVLIAALLVPLHCRVIHNWMHFLYWSL